MVPLPQELPGTAQRCFSRSMENGKLFILTGPSSTAEKSELFKSMSLMKLDKLLRSLETWDMSLVSGNGSFTPENDDNN
jgi:hypothetical protein